MSRARVILTLLVVLAVPRVNAEGFAIEPYLQDPRADGALVCFETSTTMAAEVVVDTGDGPHSFPSAPATRHEVRVSGLVTGHYRYRVRAGESTSMGTLTCAATDDQFTFVVYGDNRDRDEDHTRIVHSILGAPADFALHTGDMTGDAGVAALWRRFFAIEAPLLGSVPMYPSLGNHEYLNDPLATHYHHFFIPPIGAFGEPPPRDTPYYAFRQGNSLFIALDASRSREPRQAAFLERTLVAGTADKSLRHTFVFFHQPPFSVTDFCGSATEQALWVPEFRVHGVRAVFAGHSHAYEHMEREGVRYFVTGGGGAPLVARSSTCPSYDQEALRLFRSVHHFLRVRVQGDEAVLDAIADTGEVIDTVRLHERAPIEKKAPPPIPWKDPPAHEPAAETHRRMMLKAARTVAGTVALAALLLVAVVMVLRRGRRRLPQ